MNLWLAFIFESKFDRILSVQINIYGVIVREAKGTGIYFVSGTDRGLVRNNNEDACLVFHLPKNDQWILIIADGMGGHRKGDVASRIAVNSVSERLFRELDTNDSSEEICRKIIDTSERANVRVYLESISNDSMKGMGTTLLLGVVDKNNMHIGNIGDCRAYVLRGDSKFYRITKDHSYAQDLIDSGDIDESEARVHPGRHVLTRSLGSPNYVQADIFVNKITANDRWLFCSDGLHSYVSELEIAKVLKEARSPEEAVHKMIELANDAGGRDNVSVIVGFADENI